MQNKATVIEIGRKYGLTSEEAIQLYEQYWMEFVIRKLASLNFDYISIMSLGSFVANPKMIKKRYETFETNDYRKVRLRALYTAAYKSRFKREPELGLD